MCLFENLSFCVRKPAVDNYPIATSNLNSVETNTAGICSASFAVSPKGGGVECEAGKCLRISCPQTFLEKKTSFTMMWTWRCKFPHNIHWCWCSPQPSLHCKDSYTYQQLPKRTIVESLLHTPLSWTLNNSILSYASNLQLLIYLVCRGELLL